MAKPEVAAKANGKKADKKPGLIKRTGRFFKDLKSEYKKIVWPTKKQVLNNTIVVILVVVILGAFIAGLDTLLTFLVNLVLNQA